MERLIGVVGAGVMGQGVALLLAQHGHKVILIDIDRNTLENAQNEMISKYRMYQAINESLTNDRFMENIKFTTEYSSLDRAEIVIENIPEIMELKKEVYSKLDCICKKDCIFLVNTSCLSITEIASFTKRPQLVIGGHFMNPVPLTAAVEVINGMHTNISTTETIKEFLKEIGKESIIINDSVGFVSNRISHLMMNEAAFLVYEKVAEPEQIDRIFKQCYGHKMGPLETADLIGLDTVMNSLKVLYDNYQDPKFRCCPLLKKMVNAGMYGQKSGKGFYEYFSIDQR